MGREHYQRKSGNTNSRNGTYKRGFTLKGVGKVQVKVPRDRNGAFHTKVIPKSQHMEKALVDDISLMFLTDISTISVCAMASCGRFWKLSKRPQYET